MAESFPLGPDIVSEAGEAELDRAAKLLAAAMRSIHSGPVAPTGDMSELQHWLKCFDFEGPAQAKRVIAETLERFIKSSVHTVHPRYFGLFNPAPVIWGEIADMMSARLNPQLAVWSHAPAAVEIEQHVVRFMADRAGLTGGSGFFTSGGEEANRCGVQTALAGRWPNYPRSGLRALDTQPIFYASQQSHLAWLKIASALGLGHDAVRLVPVRENLGMDMEAMKRLIDADRASGLTPFLVAATAGTTSAGVIDALPEAADIADQKKLALHVDAAWAGAAILSDRWRPALAGIERADSITIDAHKWLSQPMGTGMFFTRHVATLDAAFGVDTAYMPKSAEGRADYYRTTPTWSRRWLGLRLFLTLAISGRKGFEAQIDRDVALGETLRVLLQRAGWQVVNSTPLPVICFTGPGREGDVAWHQAVAAHVVDSGEAWLSTVLLDGRPALRACVTNWRSDLKDLEILVAALDRAVGRA